MKLNYCIKLPNYVGPDRSWLYHHKLFAEFREWLEANVGKQEIDWAYITGDIHASGICFDKKEDLVAFLLKFNIK